MNNILLEEKYILEKTLQESRMGTTFLAKKISDGSKCIIKSVVLNTYNQANIKSIEDESKVLSHLNHKNIPKLIEVFTKNEIIDNIEQTNIFLVQEYIEGQNLQEIIDTHKAFSEIEAVEIIIQLCNICKYIHSFSPPIIHQDIKPANIIISNDKSVHLIDFGAVKQKILNTEKSGLSTIIGTQGFMSIEQFEGKAIPASDIYSMGLTLIALITRKSPLLLDKKGLNFTFNDIKISENLKKILLKMTAPDWQKRYKNTSDLKEDLELFLSNPNKNIVQMFFSKESTKNFIKHQIAENEKIKILINNKKNIDLNKKLGIYLLITLSSVLLHFMFGFIILFLYIGFSIKRARKKFNQKDYVITDKRLMIIESENNYKRIESYNTQDFKLVTIPENSYKNSHGDIILIRNNEERIILKNIENVDIVYKIFRELIKENLNGK
jgi:serine/threonine protein kinase